MSVEVTPRAAEVLRRAFEAGRLDPATHALRIRVVRGLRGEEIHTAFADEPEPGEDVVIVDGLRVYLPSALAERGATVDVSAEHDKIVVR